MQDRLRKATEDNRELAATLRRDAEAAMRQRSAQKPGKKRTTGSDLNSFRDSEERQSSTGRGTKRARDAEIEKVNSNKYSRCSRLLS
jgi:mortality factor 4-like protein 1